MKRYLTSFVALLVASTGVCNSQNNDWKERIETGVSEQIAEIIGQRPAPSADDWRVTKFGRFMGEPDIRPRGKKRKFRLLRPFGFVDSKGRRWPVPIGTYTYALKPTLLDGASIPWPFWTLIGGPFTGPYFRASVVHDYYCDYPTTDWQSTHRMYYDGMLANGADVVTAKTMYWAVYRFGPRWEFRDVSWQTCTDQREEKCFWWSTITKRVAVFRSPPWAFNAAMVSVEIQKNLREIIERNPSLEEIEKMGDFGLDRLCSIIGDSSAEARAFCRQ
jgi:hypothetical protein